VPTSYEGGVSCGPCVEFVLDSHVLELRVLGLIFGVEGCLAESFWNVCGTCPFQRRIADILYVIIAASSITDS
jgi:hypothetical protein